MNEEPTDKTENLRDTEQLITEIEALISRIELLRIRIALYLLLSGVSPQGGETPDRWKLYDAIASSPNASPLQGAYLASFVKYFYWTDALDRVKTV